MNHSPDEKAFVAAPHIDISALKIKQEPLASSR
jgi:hypothetical protein